MPQTAKNLIDLSLEYWPEQIRPFKKGRILYWQGDPVGALYIIHNGAVKLQSVSSDGRKVHSHGILGKGHILGATDYFLDSIHHTTAEVIESARMVMIPREDFQSAISSDPRLSSMVMRELAKESQLHFTKTQNLSFLDVQERLKQSLIQLASEHGVQTSAGIKIDIPVTHEDMGDLVNANRTTITLALQELKKLGYLHTESRRFVLIPIEHIRILDHLYDAIVSGSIKEAALWARTSIEKQVDPVKAMGALANGMKEIDRRYVHGQIELNDIMWVTAKMKQALPIIEQAIRSEGIDVPYIGRILFGTVKGDVHDIGKTMTIMLLKARGFEVIDLGTSISPAEYVEAVRTYQPDVLAMSALLTTTQYQMKYVIEALENAGLRDKVRIMVGGLPIDPDFAKEIGADGSGFEARDGVEMAWRWCTEQPRTP